MARQEPQHGWAIGAQHEDGAIGYITDDQKHVRLYPSELSAKMALTKMKKDDRYSWNEPFKVYEYNGKV